MTVLTNEEREFIKGYIHTRPHEARSCGLTKLWMAFQDLEAENKAQKQKKASPKVPKTKGTAVKK